MKSSHLDRLPNNEYVRREGNTPRPGSEKFIRHSDPEQKITVSIITRSFIRNGGELLASKIRHISRKEFYSRSEAFEQDIRKVLAFASSHGLTVAEVATQRRTIKLAGTVARISEVFGIQLDEYEIDGKRYRMHREPVRIPRELDEIILGVFGLDNRPVAEPQVRQFTPNACASPLAPSFNPPQVASAYGFPTGVTGKGQTIGILELGGGYSMTDMANYFQQIGVPLPSITDVSVDGVQNNPKGNQNSFDQEVALDIQICGSIAPGADIMVYFAPFNDQGFLDALSTAVHHPHTSIISISWAGVESVFSNDFFTTWNSFCQDAAMLGITILAGSGDRGSSNGLNDNLSHVTFPASSPFVLGCGGTTISVAQGTINGEIVWNTLCGATGGGVSDIFGVPAYQNAAGVPASANPNGRIGRGVPDVSGNADPASGYNILVDGVNMVIGGTSAVAPLWAAYIALINEWRGENLGMFNVWLYNNFSNSLRDINMGNNGAYNANNGWDACTGLGSPGGMSLLSAIECATVQHQIKPVKSECGLFGIQGGVTTFVAELVTVPYKATVTYNWTITAGGSNIIGPNNKYSVVISVPANNQGVSLSVTVSIDGCTFTDTFSFVPIDPDLAYRIEKFCKLRSFVHRNMFFDPLWDPLRDLVTHPLSPDEIRQMTITIERAAYLLNEAIAAPRSL